MLAPSSAHLLEQKQLMMAARCRAHPVLGWEVPAQTLHFSKLLSKGRYGDIFQGKMDGHEVMIKTVKPDCGQVSRDEFDRELAVLW